MHQQVVLVDECLGDETAGEAGSAVRDDRLASWAFNFATSSAKSPLAT
jgi:hypothetical protein